MLTATCASRPGPGAASWPDWTSAAANRIMTPDTEVMMGSEPCDAKPKISAGSVVLSGSAVKMEIVTSSNEMRNANRMPPTAPGAIIGIVGLHPWNGFVHGLALGFVCAVVAPLGDLCESLLKRDIGVKDFGDLLPGHGGVLDRFDTILFCLPAAFYLLWYFVF